MLPLRLSHKNTFQLGLPDLLSVVTICLLFFSYLFFTNAAHAEKSYIKCWKNAAGLTECGNRVPREFYNQRVRYIDDKGVTRKVKEKAKTKEEIDAEKEMEKLLALEAEQKRKSKEYDEVLLKTYLTIDDLLASLNSKLDIIKSRSVIQQSGLELKKREFSTLVRKAADTERAGKQISEKLAEKLDSARNELRNLQAQISTQEENSQHIQKTFAHDVERFMLSKADKMKHSLSTPSQAKKLRAVRLTCLTKIQCDMHWKKAIDFMKEFSTTKVLYETDKVAVSDVPVKFQDVAMGLSTLR